MRFGHLLWVSGIPEMSLGHPATEQKLKFGHPSMKYHLLVWRCAVVITKNSATWTKIRIKQPNPASITQWRRVTTTQSSWESSYRARPPPCWDALNSSFGHPQAHCGMGTHGVCMKMCLNLSYEGCLVVTAGYLQTALPDTNCPWWCPFGLQTNCCWCPCYFMFIYLIF